MFRAHRASLPRALGESAATAPPHQKGDAALSRARARRGEATRDRCSRPRERKPMGGQRWYRVLFGDVDVSVPYSNSKRLTFEEPGVLERRSGIPIRQKDVGRSWNFQLAASTCLEKQGRQCGDSRVSSLLKRPSGRDCIKAKLHKRRK